MAKKKTTPSWKSDGARSHRSRLEKMTDRSVVQAPRGGIVIVEEVVMLSERISHEDKLDVRYALELIADCMGVAHKRLQVEKKKTKKTTAKRR